MNLFAGASAHRPLAPSSYIYDKKRPDQVVYQRGSLGDAKERSLFHGGQMQYHSQPHLFIGAVRDAESERPDYPPQADQESGRPFRLYDAGQDLADLLIQP